jgi:hypothetical protein
MGSPKFKSFPPVSLDVKAIFLKDFGFAKKGEWIEWKKITERGKELATNIKEAQGSKENMDASILAAFSNTGQSGHMVITLTVSQVKQEKTSNDKKRKKQ